jgi:hypothetical protein
VQPDNDCFLLQAKLTKMYDAAVGLERTGQHKDDTPTGAIDILPPSGSKARFFKKIFKKDGPGAPKK